jgi:hypothetical protein
MSNGQSHRSTGSPFDRRTLLAGVGALGALTLCPTSAAGAAPTRGAGSGGPPAGGAPPLPAVLRSRRALTGAGGRAAGLPITELGTTYNLAQVTRWLDDTHFAVGRWDGTMSVFDFQTAPFTGPLVTDVVNTPTAEGVRMITPVLRRAVVTSNDAGSVSLWVTPGGGWTDLRLRRILRYDPALGVATSGLWLPDGPRSVLVVGHDSGRLSIWSVRSALSMRLVRTVDVRNPTPVNPWDLHAIYDLALLPGGGAAHVLSGSDDGYLSIVEVATGRIVTQRVFNPAAQRGINALSVRGDRILVANCSVGADDDNLWYFSVDPSTWRLRLLDSMNLLIDPAEVQSFNFDVVWAEHTGGPCWFAATEEGALWMGTAGDRLDLIGRQSLRDGAIGAALDYTDGPGRLVAVIHDLHQFSTGA